MFFRRRPARPGPIRLLTPPHRATTEPLQKHYWKTDAEFEAADMVSAPPGGPLPWSSPEAAGVDRSQPKSVGFSWMPPTGVREPLTYDLVLSRSPELSAPLVVRGVSEPMVRVRHLLIDTVYYWRVTATVAGLPVSESPVWAFRTHPATPRWIRVPDATNVRDLGGWGVGQGRRVRQECLYRSSELNSHIALTAEGESTILRELRIRTELDLRGEAENPQPAFPGEWVNWVHAPIEPYDLIGGPVSRDGLRRVFEVLAEPDSYPVLFHCWAGADRAGTLAFLINALLGVSFEDLVRDYELSSLSVWGERSRSAPEFVAMLDFLSRYGGGGVVDRVGRFLCDIGVSGEQISRLRAHLTEDVVVPDWGRFSESY
jgi:hypothetical protein